MANSDYSARGLALPFCPTARLTSAIGALQTTVTMTGYVSPIADGIRIGMAAMIEDEIVVVEGRSGNTLTLGRGTCDTIPAPHPANATIFFFDDSLGTDDRQYIATESVGIKPLPRTNSGGPVPIEASPPEGITFNWRFLRPYPPGFVLVNGQPFTSVQPLGPLATSLVLTWTHRDRIVQQDQLLNHMQASVGPEPGTTYRIRVIRTSDNSVRRTVDLGIVTTWAYTFAQMVADFGPSAADIPAYLTLESRRAGLGSWQAYRIDFVAQASIQTGFSVLGTSFNVVGAGNLTLGTSFGVASAGNGTLDVGYEVNAVAAPAPVASFYALRTGAAAYQKSMGWTQNTFPEFPLNNIAAAWAAQHQFRLTSGAGAPQTYESAAIAPFAPFSGSFNDATNGVTVTVAAANGAIVEVPLGETDGEGRYSVAWSLNGTSSAMPNNGTKFAALQTNGQTVTFTFNQLVASFGLYLIDYLDFGGTGTLRIFNGATELFSESLTSGLSGAAADGIVGFVGYCANTVGAPFDRVTITFTATASDFTGFDNIFVGTLGQRATLPVSVSQTIQFTDTSTNSPTSWLWDFGDGTTSTLQNPTKSYATTGTRTVTLTVTNAGGSNSVTKSGYIVVT